MTRYYISKLGLYNGIRQFIWSYPKGIAHEVGTDHTQDAFEEDETEFINRGCVRRIPSLFLTLTGTADIYA